MTRSRPSELKYIDTTKTGASTASDTTGDIALLNGVTQGSDYANRIGRKVGLMGISLAYNAAATVGTGVDQVMRFLIVYDKQTNGSALTITDVLDAVSVTAHPNLSNRERFVIVWDKVTNISKSGETGSIVNRQVSLSLAHLPPVIFNSGNAGTIADIATGSLYAICLGTEARGVTAGAQPFRARVSFLDL